MKCRECGHTMKTARETVKYDLCGLSYVTLVGIRVDRCEHCGESDLVIERPLELEDAITTAVLGKTGPLTGEEVRYLRKRLGWSGREAAAQLGVKPETVSRWESGTRRIGPTPDRLLRLSVAHALKLPYELKGLRQIVRDGDAILVRLAVDGGGWREAQAA